MANDAYLALLGGMPGLDSADPGQALEYTAPQAQAQAQSTKPGIGGVLKEILKQFALAAPQAVGDSVLASRSPEVYQQQQQNKRHQMDLLQALQLHNSITPYEQAQLAESHQTHMDTRQQHQFENNSAIAHGIASGIYKPVTGDEANAPGVIKSGGFTVAPVQDATFKDQVEIDPSTFDPQSELGKQFAAAHLTTKFRIPASEAFKHLQDAAEKAQLAAEKDQQQKESLATIQKAVEQGHQEIDQRFSPDYYKALYHGKVDPFAQNQARSLHTQLDAAAVSGRKAFSPTEVTQALDKIRTYQSPWEKMQEKEYTKNAEVEARVAQQQATRSDNSYKLNISELDKAEKPVDDAAEKFSGLNNLINQKTAQADSLIAPKLLSVMVGGTGSGLRMTKEEISQVIGGRDKFESLKAAVDKWIPGNGLSITDKQREQIQALVQAVGNKISKKQAIYSKARHGLVNTDDVHQHRQIMEDAQKAASDVDSPTVQDQLGVGAPQEPDFIVVNGQVQRNPKKKK